MSVSLQSRVAPKPFFSYAFSSTHPLIKNILRGGEPLIKSYYTASWSFNLRVDRNSFWSHWSGSGAKRSFYGLGKGLKPRSFPKTRLRQII